MAVNYIYLSTFYLIINILETCFTTVKMKMFEMSDNDFAFMLISDVIGITVYISLSTISEQPSSCSHLGPAYLDAGPTDVLIYKNLD